MEVGIKGKRERIVPYEQTAEYISSGLLPVFATPCMIQFMEETARLSVEPYLAEGQSTVGTLVNVKLGFDFRGQQGYLRNRTYRS